MVGHNAVQFSIFKQGDWRNIWPPKKIIEQLQEAHHYVLPKVVAVITSPTMRPDLSLLTEPGYDAATQLWYKPSDVVKLPPIPERPTREQALEQLQLLSELFDGFPFEGESKENKKSVARSAALAGLMTLAARGAIFGGVPLFLITAPDPRTGKSYLVRVIEMAAMGHMSIPIAGAEKKEEFEKRIETAGLSGRANIHLNKLPDGMVVDSDRLCELSTEGIVTIRKLGRHEEGTCDCRATTVFLNGNNIMMSGALVDRTVSCRLDAERENPGERTFNFDPIERVRGNRGVYLTAVFTIIRAFHAAGKPRPANMKRVAGFDHWSERIQQSLMWLEMPDPWGAMETMRAMDPTREELGRLLDVLKKYASELAGRFTTADCTKLAEEQTSDQYGRPYYRRLDLRELMSKQGKLDGQHFGRTLMRLLNKRKDGWHIELVPSGERTRAWRLVGPGKSGEAPPPPVEEPM
jgi:putative DNA primase/helicase